ncbi:hemin-degrading factor [Paracoccus gahaiensis]|uniref:Hemin-degrading factor n=1 Tax=Paracoccus gahaiensis TaxID=1706839 RepID=A0A4U0RFA8_9RHOB|nr:ChuX/HutX family heme-like substrate-binding protein [Paracoccus gahaiensis]TJZ93300.1 hemin-degrading factor [Paracoccus gahaiensis]
MIHPNPARRDALKRQAVLRHHDVAAEMGLPEAALVEAGLGQGAQRIDARPGRLIPAVGRLGTVMAVTRNRACVIETIGSYQGFHDGAEVAAVRNAQIDLHIDPRHWVYAFAVDLEGHRSVQIFDAAGDAVHKMHLRERSDHGAWQDLCRDLALPDARAAVAFTPRAAPEGARMDAAQTEALREGWAALTGPDQLDPLALRLGMNRLGACRQAAPPFARRLPAEAGTALLRAIRVQGLQVRLQVGNPGCRQIHAGPIRSLRPMGPLLNVVDARFSLHLRTDHLAELWRLEIPTPRGPVVSVEAFDAEGASVYRCWGMAEDEGGDPAAWLSLVEGLGDAVDDPGDDR